MGWVRYNERILCDRHFIEWLLEPPKKFNIFRKLMYIKSSSLDYEGNHNIILDFDCKELLSKGIIKELYLRAAVKEETYLYDLISETLPEETAPTDDVICKRIFYAIWLLSKTPYSCYIFTAPSQKKDYEQNPHLQKMSSVKVKSGEEALEVIEEYWKQFILEKGRRASIWKE